MRRNVHCGAAVQAIAELVEQGCGACEAHERCNEEAERGGDMNVVAPVEKAVQGILDS